jgi:hypothetical protein
MPQAPGWYPNPADATTLLWWNGTTFDGDPRPASSFATTAVADAPAGPAAVNAPDAASLNGRDLAINYIVGAIFPIYGIVAALVIGVAKKYSDVRRHALGIAAITIIAAGIYLVIFTAGGAARSDTAVQNDLANLLSQHGTFVQGASCSHQNGSQYICFYTGVNDVQHTVQVTDDGHAISEVPYP